MCLANSAPSFDPSALAELERKAFEPATSHGIELPPVDSLLFCKVGDTMFEESNWQAFKEFAARVNGRSEALSAHSAPAGRAAAAQRAPWQQQQQQPVPQDCEQQAPVLV